MIAGWAISDQKLERPEKQYMGGFLQRFLFQHDATICVSEGVRIGGGEKRMKPRSHVYTAF